MKSMVKKKDKEKEENMGIWEQKEKEIGEIKEMV